MFRFAQFQMIDDTISKVTENNKAGRPENMGLALRNVKAKGARGDKANGTHPKLKKMDKNQEGFGSPP